MKLNLLVPLFFAFFFGGCKTEKSSDAPILYHDSEYGLRFSLPASWRGYSVLARQWTGQSYSPLTDGVAIVAQGVMLVFRDPFWSADEPTQEIPVKVFTRPQWESYKQGKFSTEAGGFDSELEHNSKYVFAISSRFNADDSTKGWEEANQIVTRNRAIHEPQLFPAP